MPLIVQKFGGTSVADPGHIMAAAKRVKDAVQRGKNPIVVVSAMAGVTDRLVSYVGAMDDIGGADEYDVVVSSGEQVVAGLMALALRKIGVDSRSFLAWQVPIRTTSIHGNARILSIDHAVLADYAKAGKVPVLPGFQGIGDDRRVTTLGRGGSDTSAVALAAALEAEECEIFTDVDGIYTADPRIVETARKLDTITYDEMLELASMGSKVLQTRSVQLAAKYRVRVHVRSSFSKDHGTELVAEEEMMEKPIVSGIAHCDNEAKITLVSVADRPGVAAAIFRALADAGINVDMIVQNISDPILADGQTPKTVSDAEMPHHDKPSGQDVSDAEMPRHDKGSGQDVSDESVSEKAAKAPNGRPRRTDITFTVGADQMKKALLVLKKQDDAATCRQVIADDNVAKVSIVGVGMRAHAGVAVSMFDALAQIGINIAVISTSEIKISVLIEKSRCREAVARLHETFQLA